jgi:hypothetical protein
MGVLVVVDVGSTGTGVSVGIGAGVLVGANTVGVGEGGRDVGGSVGCAGGVTMLTSWVAQAASSHVAGMARKARRISRRVSRVVFFFAIIFASSYLYLRH